MLADTLDIHDRIMALLAESGADYRTMEHEPEVVDGSLPAGSAVTF